MKQKTGVMKNLAIILSLSLLSVTASAQKFRGGFHGSVPVYRPAVTVRAYAPLYSYGYNPFYNPYYNPYYNNPGYRYPAKLEMKLDAIKDDYKQQIKETRRDKTIPGKERRAKIRGLKTERDREVIDAKRDYFDKNMR
jgi:hypothetical protein